MPDAAPSGTIRGHHFRAEQMRAGRLQPAEPTRGCAVRELQASATTNTSSLPSASPAPSASGTHAPHSPPTICSRGAASSCAGATTPTGHRAAHRSDAWPVSARTARTRGSCHRASPAPARFEPALEQLRQTPQRDGILHACAPSCMAGIRRCWNPPAPVVNGWHPTASQHPAR